MSSVQILPNKIYSQDNITDIDISLNFHNLTLTSVDYIPLLNVSQLNFLWNQISPNFIFEADTWDPVRSQYAYTTLIDTIFKEIDNFDKYSLLANGLCVQLQGQPPWTCLYIDQPYFIQKNKLKTQYPLITTVYPGGTIFKAKYSDIFNYSICGEDNRCYITTSRMNDNISINYYECNINDEQLYLSGTYKSINYSSIDMKIRDISVIGVNRHDSCPLGFEQNSACSCECIKEIKERQYTCDISTNQITSPSNYWTGFDAETTTILISSHCPPNYCNLDLKTFSLSNKSLMDLSCLNNRTGILCGKCKGNYSAVFGSNACYSHCTHLYLLTIPVYALAGLFLVVILFVLRLTVATGTINGVIFYANILGLVMNKLIESHNGIHLDIYHIIISLLNLELGFPLCFYEGMTPAEKLGFQYIFPIYLWSIVIGLVIASKCSIKISNLISNMSVQVLATLLYLSYSKLVRIPIYIISYSWINYIDRSQNMHQKQCGSTMEQIMAMTFTWCTLFLQYS